MKALIVRPLFMEEAEINMEDLKTLVGGNPAPIPLTDGIVGVVNADAWPREGYTRNMIVYNVFGRCLLGTCVLVGFKDDTFGDLPDMGGYLNEMRKVEEFYREVRRRFGE